MANVLQSFRFLPSIASKYGKNPSASSLCTVQQLRSLYSAASLGLEAYIEMRKRTDLQLGNISEKFRTKMQEYAAPDSKNMIFTEDLKNMIHLAHANDIPLVIDMMNKFNEQNKQLRFGNFIFGPVVMRMLHMLNKPQEALECFNSPKLDGFFDQMVTYQILMDLLYENEMYTEILQTFEKIQARQLMAAKYPRNIIVLTMGACYKLNTPEMFKFATNLWGDLKDAGHLPMRRAITFYAGLALQQNAPEVALEVAGTARNQNYATIRNIRALALARIGRLDDALQILKGILEQENSVKQTFNKEVVEEIKDMIQKGTNAELKAEIGRIEKYFIEQEHFSKQSLAQQLCSEIKTPPYLGDLRLNSRNPQLANRFERFQRGPRSYQDNRMQRPGLLDMQ